MTNFEQITSLIITRRNAVYWVCQVNDEDITRDAAGYTGSREGDLITIKTISGAPLTLKVPYSYIQYYDANDADNNLINPGSAEEMQGHLIAQNFYVNFNEGGGGGSAVQTFKALLDVLVPSFIGRAGQAVVVSDNEQYLETAAFSAPLLQGLANYLGGDFLPNRFVVTSSTVGGDGIANGFGLADPINIINRAPRFDEMSIVKKGYVWVDNAVVKNEQDYIVEVGDVVEKWFFNEPDDIFPYGQLVYMPFGRWNGGDTNLLNSFTYAVTYAMPFFFDPDREV